MLCSLRWLLTEYRELFKVSILIVKLCSRIGYSNLQDYHLLCEQLLPIAMFHCNNETSQPICGKSVNAWLRPFKKCTPRPWNSLLQEMRITTVLTTFRNKCKTHFGLVSSQYIFPTIHLFQYYLRHIYGPCCPSIWPPLMYLFTQHR